jgi:predicted nuclease with TOPRIM domain
MDLEALEELLAGHVKELGNRLARRVGYLADRIARLERGEVVVSAPVRTTRAPRPLREPPPEAPELGDLRRELESRQAALEGTVAARVDELLRALRQVQAAMEMLPERLDDLDERIRRVDEKADRAAARIAHDPSARVTEDLRRELTEDLADVRDGLGTQIAARDARLSAFQDRLDELDTRVSRLDGPTQETLLSDDRRVGALETRLAALEQAHQALAALAERTSRETATRLSRRVEDVRDAIGVQLSELRRAISEVPESQEARPSA